MGILTHIGFNIGIDVVLGGEIWWITRVVD